jgi:hypothetical protein
MSCSGWGGGGWDGWAQGRRHRVAAPPAPRRARHPPRRARRCGAGLPLRRGPPSAPVPRRRRPPAHRLRAGVGVVVVLALQQGLQPRHGGVDGAAHVEVRAVAATRVLHAQPQVLGLLHCGAGRPGPRGGREGVPEARARAAAGGTVGRVRSRCAGSLGPRARRAHGRPEGTDRRGRAGQLGCVGRGGRNAIATGALKLRGRAGAPGVCGRGARCGRRARAPPAGLPAPRVGSHSGAPAGACLARSRPWRRSRAD